MQPTNDAERLAHAKGIGRYCQYTKHKLMGLMTFYTVNDDGAYLGVKLRDDWLPDEPRILVVAHIDHHCTGVVHKINRRMVVSSALDDRLGVYVALEVLPQLGIKADVLLCDDEESANTSIRNLGMSFLLRYNWIMELDYPGIGATTYDYLSTRDAVADIYGSVSPGSFSDITEIQCYSPVGAFNAGVGYLSQHTESCFVRLDDFLACCAKIKQFHDKYGGTKFVENDDVHLMEPILDVHQTRMYADKTFYGNKQSRVRASRGGSWEHPDDALDYAHSHNDDMHDDASLFWEQCAMCNKWRDPFYMERVDGYYVCPECWAEWDDDIAGDSKPRGPKCIAPKPEVRRGKSKQKGRR